MSTNTATIETLTAEVRVLMVGKRQITKSVVKQLDRVAFDDITPFGRVRLDDDDDSVEVVGALDGQLVVAHVQKPPARQEAGSADWHHWMEDRHHSPTWVKLDEGCRLEWLVNPNKRVCIGTKDWHYWKCDPPSLERRALAAARAAIAEHEAALIPFRAAEALPLIVLAGLR